LKTLYKEPKVSVVILNYNKPKFTVDCVNSVLHSDYTALEVIVVDNFSEFSSFISLSERIDKSKVTLIRTNRNIGYAGGNNVGILRSTGKYILLLNDDIIVNRTLISGLVRIAEKNSSIGMIGPATYRYDSGKLWGYSSEILKETNDIVDVPLVVGAAVMVSRTALNKIGLLDDNYFMYHEDWDWCFRFREAGYRTVCAPKLIAWHNIQDQNLKIFAPYYAYYYHRNYFLFAAKHCSSMKETISFLFKRLVWQKNWMFPFIYPLIALKSYKKEAIKAYSVGIIDGLTFLLRSRVLMSAFASNIYRKHEDSIKSCPSKEWIDGIF
jgi:GT2 family glycosyltransferase